MQDSVFSYMDSSHQLQNGSTCYHANKFPIFYLPPTSFTLQHQEYSFSVLISVWHCQQNLMSCLIFQQRALSLKISMDFSQNWHFPAPSYHFSAFYSHTLYMQVYLSNNYYQLPETWSFTGILWIPEIFQGSDMTEYMPICCKIIETTQTKVELCTTCCYQYHYHSAYVDFWEGVLLFKKDRLTIMK